MTDQQTASPEDEKGFIKLALIASTSQRRPKAKSARRLSKN